MRSIFAIVTAVTIFGLATVSSAQKLTERYIPIGKSPGLSDKVRVIGEIESVNPQARTITIRYASGSVTVKIADKTRIWRDRSAVKATNLDGAFDDLQKGRRVECKFEDPARKDVAEWIKVEVG